MQSKCFARIAPARHIFTGFPVDAYASAVLSL